MPSSRSSPTATVAAGIQAVTLQTNDKLVVGQYVEPNFDRPDLETEDQASLLRVGDGDQWGRDGLLGFEADSESM